MEEFDRFEEHMAKLILKPKLYMLIGVPGSGKSTWAANQDWAADCAYISTDTYVEEHAKKVGKTYTEVFNDVMGDAVAHMLDSVLIACSQEQDIIWDQTSTTIATRAKKLRMLPNYHAIAVVFPTPYPDELWRRLDSRPGKVIPEVIVDSMIVKWEEPTEEEGFHEIWRI